MHVVVAPDKFKGSLTAERVAAAVAAGLRSARPGVLITTVPVADGGDGTIAAALSAGFTRRTVRVDGPTGQPVESPYAVRGRQAVVELAAAVGLDRLPGGRPDPLGASTYGLGQIVAAAVDSGATEVVLGLGGSASTDGGAGLVSALGAELRDTSGRPLPRGGAALAEIATLDLTALSDRMTGVDVVVAGDVTNPLLGPQGAAAVFGPQKGAGPEDVALLERALRRWATVVAAATGTDLADAPGAGAAGGTGFAALALLGSRLHPGVELVLGLVGFDGAAAGADLVVTGEGSLDAQTLAGKAPYGVARAAARHRLPVVAVAGRCLLDPDQLREAGIAAAYPLSDLEPDPARSIARAADLLEATGHRIGLDWLGPNRS